MERKRESREKRSLDWIYNLKFQFLRACFSTAWQLDFLRQFEYADSENRGCQKLIPCFDTLICI